MGYNIRTALTKRIYSYVLDIKKVLFSLKILNIAADRSDERADPDQTAPSMVT